MAYIYDTEFDIIPDYHTRIMLLNAYKSVCSVDGAWNWLKNCNEKSFKNSDSPYIGVIENKMEELGYYDHSGSSFGWTMKQMETIVKHGKTKFFSQFYSNVDGDDDYDYSNSDDNCDCNDYDYNDNDGNTEW